MSPSDVVIVSAKRTPIGAFLGALSPLSAVQLGSAAMKAALEAAGLSAAEVQEVIMGCVLPANLGQAPEAGGIVVVGPAKLEGGSGGPVRIFVLLKELSR